MLKKKNNLNDIRFFLKKFLFKNKVPKDYLSKELLKFNNMDSMMMFRLIVTLESKYKIKIKDNELFSNKFKNIDNISKLLEKKINAIKKK
jgi:acyl carrier protein